MSQVSTFPQLRQPVPRVKSDLSLGALYALVVLTPIVLKLAHRTNVATWPWVKVLSPLWAPWLLLVALSICGWFVRWASRLYDRERAT